MKKVVAHLPCLCCKVKCWTSPERSVIPLDQNSASVWNFWWNYTPLFDMISSSSFCFETWLSYSSMSLHVLIIFLNFFGTFIVSLFFSILWVLHVSHSFLLAQPFCFFLRYMLERSYFRAWSNYFGGDGKHVLACSQCRNSSLLWCVREF